jgi:hypothetical protein
MPLANTPMTTDMTLPRSGVVIRNEGTSPATLALRRFGETFDPVSGQVAPQSLGMLSLPPDRAPSPWQLQISTTSTIFVCGLSSVLNNEH